MGLNKQRGNMYPWVTDTWNPIRGRCEHGCSYCFAVRQHTKPLRFVEKELKTNLGEGRMIFLGSATDMFAWGVPQSWIEPVLAHCRSFRKNGYLLQTKNPERFYTFHDQFPEGVVLGTTIETNRNYELSRAPKPIDRLTPMALLSHAGFCTMVSVEPILDFDVAELIASIKLISPSWVSIGADSQGHHLSEPPAWKINALITGLRSITEVKIKPNLSRLRR